MKKNLEQTTLKIEGQLIPIKIYRERRRNVRASMGKTAFILRMPYLMPTMEERKHLSWFEDWVKTTLRKHPKAKAQFETKTYETGDTIQVGKRQYVLEVDYEDRKQHYAKMEGETIHLQLNPEDTPLHLNKSIRHLISRVVASDFLPEIEQRVQAINERHFQKKVNRVYLKYNQSNWGSCSSKGNINLSTRLLFAPDEVIDYVIIHELAHRVEMNHSDRFWNVVAKVMPDYKRHEKWLKKQGYLYDF